MTESTEKLAGGSGGLLEDPTKIGADVAFISRAIRERWDIPAHTLCKVPAAMQEILDNPKTTKRTRIMAARVLGQLKADNQRDVHHVERLEQENGILKLKMVRAEEGKPNDSLAIITPPVEELPLPAWLRDMRRRILEPSES